MPKTRQPRKYNTTGLQHGRGAQALRVRFSSIVELEMPQDPAVPGEITDEQPVTCLQGSGMTGIITDPDYEDVQYLDDDFSGLGRRGGDLSFQMDENFGYHKFVADLEEQGYLEIEILQESEGETDCSDTGDEEEEDLDRKECDHGSMADHV